MIKFIEKYYLILSLLLPLLFIGYIIIVPYTPIEMISETLEEILTFIGLIMLLSWPFFALILAIFGILLVFRKKYQLRKTTLWLLIVFNFFWAILVSFAVFGPGYGYGALFNQDLLNLFAQFQEEKPNIIKAYQKIFIPEAWNFVNEKNVSLANIKIGIIDSGIDSRHPEFNNVNFGSSMPDDLIDSGISISGALVSHGTNVAGIIGANDISATSSANYIFPQMNGLVSGIKRLNYSLESRKVEENLIFTLFDAKNRINELSQIGIPIINLSRGTFAQFGEAILRPAIERASTTLFIIAAGNNNASAEFVSPANLGNDLNNVITVGATNLDDGRLKSLELNSNFGSSVNISAPGENVYSPSFFRGQPRNPLLDYDSTFSGTSAAAPMVTGVAAILKSLEPEYQKFTPGLVMNPAKIKEILIKSADPFFVSSTDLEAGKLLGSGCSGIPPTGQVLRGCRLNALKAVQGVIIGI